MLIRKVLLVAGTALFGLLAITTCDKWVEDWDDQELYVDPNRPTEVSIDQMFMGFQVNCFFFQEGSLARIAAIWTQQLSGTERQTFDLGTYSFTAQDFNNEWYQTYPGGGLIDIRGVIEKADAADRRHYAGIGKVWEALHIGTIASLWGDIPYSEAVDPEIDEPAFDDMAAVYADLQALLDEAIVDLGVSDGGASPSGIDLVFAGDTEKWIAAAYTLKARLYMHWAEDAPANYPLALAAANSGIASVDDNFQAAHGTASPEATIWSQFQTQRSGYMRAGKYLVDLLKSRNDPRLTIYFDTTETGIVLGSDPGDGFAGASDLSATGYGAPDHSVDILTYEENQLIIAECEYQAGIDANALAALNDVRTALETKHGLAAGTYPDLTGLTGPDLFDAIMEEKYISLFYNIEVWNDYKRTCRPAITPYESGTVPGRLYYPTSEVNTNTNTPDNPVSGRNDNDPGVCP